MARILLVEDNEMNRDLISRRLKRKGYEIVMAVDGAEAVDRAVAEKPDLIVMDMGLPVLDGYEATRLIKADEGTRDIPIIGLSAHAMSGDADRARAAGCDDYDTKPVEWSRLLPKLETLLERSREARRGVESAEMPTTMLSPAATTESGRVSRILIADDSSMNRETLQRRLGELGYRSETVENGAQALGKLEQETFDALLLDVKMPDASGQDVLRRLRADPRWQDLPVLMITPIDGVDSAIACFEHGAADFVPQPFQVKVLAARLKTLLGRRGETRAVPHADDVRHSDHLLRILLPDEIVEELRRTEKVLPRRHAGSAVLMAGVEGFQGLCDAGDPLDPLARLQELLVAYEEIAARHRITQVKTSGDSVTLAAGLFDTSAEPVLDCVRCALEMREAARGLRPEWTVRFGIHRGPVVAGVVGRRKVHFDLWGATVEATGNVLRHGAAGEICLSDAAWHEVGSVVRGVLLDPVVLPSGDSLALYRVDRLA